MSYKILRACVVLAAVSACAKPAPSSAPLPSPEPGVIMSADQAQPTVNRNRDIITKEELQAPAVNSLSAFDVVRTLRPHFLAQRGKNNVPVKDANGAHYTDDEAGQPHASIDGAKVTALDELKSINANQLIEIRYLTPSQAMQKFGGSARQGPVILVRTM